MTPHEIVNRYERVRWQRRGNLETYLDQIGRYFAPGRDRYFQDNLELEESIQWSRWWLFDSTGPLAARTLANSLNGSITSQWARWFEYKFRDSALVVDHEAQVFLEEARDRVWYALAESNFYSEIANAYYGGCTEGSVVMFHTENDDNRGFQFRCPPLREVLWEEDHEHRPIVVYRRRHLTGAQIGQQFKNVPSAVQTALESQQSADKIHGVIHCIYKDVQGPVDHRLRPGGSRPYKEKWVLEAGSTELQPIVIQEGNGYHEMPAHVFIWERISGTQYGQSPAMIGLGTVLSLNRLYETDIRAREKAVDPPMKQLSKGVLGDVQLMPGGLTTVRDMNGIAPLLDTNAYRFDASDRKIEDMRAMVNRIFYVDQLQLKESPAMTATEVQVSTLR